MRPLRVTCVAGLAVVLAAVAGLVVFRLTRPDVPGADAMAGPGGNAEKPEAVPAAEEDGPAGIKPTEMAGEKVVLLLPAPVADLAVGGGGRYLVLHFPSLRRLAVFDVNEGRIVKYIALPADRVKFAAGIDKLLVLLPGDGAVKRLALGTWECEASAVLPEAATAKHLSLGSASRGPALLAWGEPRFGGGAGGCDLLDPATLRVEPLTWDRRALIDPGLIFRDVRAAAGAPLFGVAFESGLPGALLVGEGRGEVTTLGHIPTAVVPAPDGSVLYTNLGLFTREGKRIGAFGPIDERRRVPACHGLYYLEFEPAGDRWVPSLYVAGDARPLLHLPKIQAAFPRDDWQAPGLGNDKRVHFIPRAKLVVTIPPTDDRLVLHRLDVEEALKGSGIDYLLVTSGPPTTVKKGGTYAHQLTVKSKQGGVRCRLESGPAGMRVTPAGQITWDVPADYPAEEANAVLCVRDRSGQELFRPIRVAVVP